MTPLGFSDLSYHRELEEKKNLKGGTKVACVPREMSPFSSTSCRLGRLARSCLVEDAASPPGGGLLQEALPPSTRETRLVWVGAGQRPPLQTREAAEIEATKGYYPGHDFRERGRLELKGV